jgi:xylulokinase
MMSYLGLDLGTSGLKAVLIDAEQRLIGQATASLTVSRPQPGWSEQAPADWIAAAEAALVELAARCDLSGLKGIGLSGQMHGATLLDAADRPLRPCILWNDTRAHLEADEMDADPRFRTVSGNIVFPGFTAPKLLWTARHAPEVFARTAKVLLPKDYLRLWLTGEHVSEMSDASGTSWLDVGAREWSDTLLGASGMAREQMPRLVEGSEISGRLRPVLAQRLGLPAGVPVAGGGGDNAATAIGMGILGEGQGFASLGTSGVLFAANDSFRPNAASAVHAFCHAVPGRWHQMGVILAATDTLNWFAGITGRTPAELTASLGALEPPGRVLFLPYLGGDRTPHNDARIRGAFLGLEHAAGRDALTRAVMEGVSYAFADCRDALAAAGTRIDRVTAVGGGSRSEHWLAILATVLGCPVDVPTDSEVGAAFGAARLALIAAEGGEPDAVCAPPAIAHSIEPDGPFADAFAAAHVRYRDAYARLRGY